MSHKLKDFVELISLETDAREEMDIKNYVTWLRRRVALLHRIETSAVVEIIRHSRHIGSSRDDLLCQQGHYRDGSGPMKFFILLRGAISIFINPYLAIGKFRRKSTSSIERVLRSASAAASFLSVPKSASSKRTSGSRMSQTYAPLTENPETGLSDEESDTSETHEATEDKCETNYRSSPTSALTPINIVAQSQTLPKETEIPSRSSKRSRKEISRGKLGNFVVKCEKGNNFDEESLIDQTGFYNASVIFDEDTNIMVIDEEIFNKYIKEHHENETTTMSNFVDNHPFFSGLPVQSRGMLQVSLKNQHFSAGTHIVKQGESVAKLIFLISGSAEEVVQPGKHRYQYPELWPFETSSDVYYNECEWLRDSRKRLYKRRYEFNGEVDRRSKNVKGVSNKKTEISVCAVQNQEVVGMTEIILDLPSYYSSLRCISDCEIYTLNLRAFRRIIKRKHPEVMNLIQAYIQKKLRFRLETSLDDSVPLIKVLYNNTERLLGEELKGVTTRNNQKLKDKEKTMLKLLEWFKLDKAPLVKDLDVDVIQLMEKMKNKAKLRERQRSLVAGGPQREFFRRGCIAAVKPGREPLSLHKLRDPMNELMLRLKMEGTFVSDERELEELLMRFSVTPICDSTDIRNQASRITDEEYRVLRYRRYGNRLVRNFVKMVDTRDPRHLLGAREKTLLSSALFDEAISEYGENNELLMHENKDLGYNELASVTTRPTTYKSKATTDTYKSLQFDRRSVTPGTLTMRIKDFHTKLGGTEAEIQSLPQIKNHRDLEFEEDNEPVPGGKVFVTVAPCVSCRKNVRLKNHNHIRCKMLHTLPMDKVKTYE